MEDLPRKVINAIYLDDDGYLWVGTRGGLYRYDGYETVHFVADRTDSTALINNNVTGIGQDPRGNLYISTASGLSVQSPGQRTFRSFFDRDFVRPVRFDERGRGWAVIGKRGLLCFNAHHRIENIQRSLMPVDLAQYGLGLPRSVSLVIDSLRDQLTLVGDQSITLNRENLRPRASKTPAGGNVVVLGEILWRITGDRRIEVEIPDHRKFPAVLDLPVPAEEVLELVADGDGRIWLATVYGLYLHDGSAPDAAFRPFRPDHQFFTNNRLTELYSDRAGNVWVGSLRGVARVAEELVRFRQHLLPTAGRRGGSTKVRRLAYGSDSHVLHIASDNGLLFTYFPRDERTVGLPIPESLRVGEIFGLWETEGRLWISIGGELIETTPDFATHTLDSIENRLSVSSYAIQAVKVAPDQWWAGSWRDGLTRFGTVDTQSLAFSKLVEEVGAYPIYAVLRDQRDRVWIGERGGGIKRVQLPAGPVASYSKRTDSGLASDGINDLFEDSQGRIWAATWGGGVALFDEERQAFRSFTLEDGLPDLTVCSIGETGNGEVWVSTSNGLARYHPDQPLAFWAFDPEDHLTNREYSFQSGATDSAGHLYFGGPVGMTEVLPVPLSKGRTFPPIRMVNFRLIGEGDDLPDPNSGSAAGPATFPAELSFRDNSFAASVSALDLSGADRIRYVYRLVNFEEEWHITAPGQRTITYHELPPGTYTLEVRNSDPDGYWNPVTTRFPFRVKQHPLLTGTAVAIYLVLAGILLFLAWWMRGYWMGLRQKLARHRATIHQQKKQMIYLSDISHEMRNRLTLILGPLERVMQGQEVDQAAVQRIYQNAVYVKQLSDRVLKMRQGQDGGFDLWVRWYELTPFLQTLCNRVQDLADIRGITLVRRLPDGGQAGYFDSNVLEIILLNLLNNSLKYTPEGGRVEVSSRVTVGEGPRLHLSVRDTGIGIAPEDLQRIFDRFYRSSNDAGGTIEGTGVGLELVSRLVNLHHGSIHIDSEEGRFTEVSLIIPLGEDFYQRAGCLDTIPALAKLTDPAPAVSDTPAGSPEPPVYTVLVVEDNVGIRDLIRETLSGTFHVLESADGRRGLEAALDHRPDLILSDLRMPEMNGLELLNHLRANQETAHIPFVLLSGRSNQRVKLDALRSGATDIIDKPFSEELLRWRIKRILADRQRLRDDFAGVRVFTLEPNGDAQQPLSADEDFLHRLNLIMEEHIATAELNVEFLAGELAMSRPTLYRHMERLLQEAPANFIKGYRLKKAALLLQERKFQVSEVAYMTGFRNPKYFSKCFQKAFGSTPSAYVREQEIGG